MATDLFLELYKGEIPDFFKNLPGAENYKEDENSYWAVLIPTPAANSEAATFIAPIGPSGPVTADTTHGSDTLPTGSTGVEVTAACIWRPKSPPYEFKVTTPNGDVFPLIPPSDSTSQDSWHCESAPGGIGLGIWIIEVELMHAGQIPLTFNGRNAHLNPEFLDFDPEHFYRQPLLRLQARTDDNQKCAEIQSLTVSGCTPGTVNFHVVINSLEDVQEISWDFGDDSIPEVYSSNFADGMSVEHAYSSTGDYIATVTVTRATNCNPISVTESVIVQACTGSCAVLNGINVSGCAPGNVTLQANVSQASQISQLHWNLGDGNSQSFTAADIAQGNGLQIQHSYSSEAPTGDDEYTVILTLVNAACEPADQMVQSAQIDIPICPSDTLCPELTGVEVTAGCVPGLVSFQATIENVTEATEIRWEFGDNTEVIFNAEAVAQGQGQQVEHYYSSLGNYTATVTIGRPEGCGSLTDSETIPVPACTDDEAECPQLAGIRVRGCAPGDVRLEAQGSNLQLVDQFNWQFGDGNSSSGSNPSVDHIYDEGGPFEVTLSIERPRHCEPQVQRARVTVELCCPELTGIGISGCSPGAMTLQAQGSNLSAAEQFEWTFGDGSSATTESSSTSHTYNSTGPFTASVTMTGPADCEPRRQTAATQSFNIPPCPPPRINWCLIWFWINVVLFAVTAIVTVAAACLAQAALADVSSTTFWIFVVLVVIAVILWIVSIISFILWCIICASRGTMCLPLLWLLAVLTFLAPFAALIGFILMGLGLQTCGIGFFLDSGYFGILVTIAYFFARCTGCLRAPDGSVRCFP